MSTSPGIGATLDEAFTALRDFIASEGAEFLPDDMSAAQMQPPQSRHGLTDHHLADLAAKHGMKLATFDGAIIHPAVELLKVIEA